MKINKFLFIAIIIAMSLASCMNTLYMSGYTPISNKQNENILFKQDEFNGMKVYEHRQLHIYKRPVQLMVGQSNGESFLSLCCKYKKEGWIFFDDVILMNSRTDKIKFHYQKDDLKREVLHGGFVSEIGYKILQREDIDKLKKFLENEDVIKVRFSGDRNYDTILKKNAIDALLEMIQFYENQDKKLAIN